MELHDDGMDNSQCYSSLHTCRSFLESFVHVSMCEICQCMSVGSMSVLESTTRVFLHDDCCCNRISMDLYLRSIFNPKRFPGFPCSHVMRGSKNRNFLITREPQSWFWVDTLYLSTWTLREKVEIEGWVAFHCADASIDLGFVRPVFFARHQVPFLCGPSF